MKTSFYVIIFVVLVLLITVTIPDSLVSHWVNVSGDGEDAIDRYEFIVLLLRLGIAAVCSGVVIVVIRKLSQR